MIYDTPENIERCLNCEKPHCTNCLGSVPHMVPMAVVRTKGKSVERFSSVKEAVEKTGFARSTIYDAAKNRRNIGGYNWRFE